MSSVNTIHQEISHAQKAIGSIAMCKRAQHAASHSTISAKLRLDFFLPKRLPKQLGYDPCDINPHRTEALLLYGRRAFLFRSKASY
jgi:hypothetical protein